jgi:hypothetical protein
MTEKKPQFWKGHDSRLKPAKQNFEMQKLFPQFVRTGYGNCSQWTGALTTMTGHRYKIRIEYGNSGAPRAYMVAPQMEPGCPHKYEEGQMCLFWPDDPENEPWGKASSLAKIILPWCAAWLHFYDIWLVTGVWEGPEKAHGVSEESNENAKR